MKDLWEELLQQKKLINEPGVFLSDFNVMRFSSEKKGKKDINPGSVLILIIMFKNLE